jgi:hypothetical protein
LWNQYRGRMAKVQPKRSPLEILHALQARAVEYGIEASLELEEPTSEYYFEDSPGMVTLTLPNGRDKRSLLVSPTAAEVLLSAPLDQLTFLGENAAYLDRSTGYVEARVVSSMNGASTSLTPIWKLPGVDIAAPKRRTGDDQDPSELPESPARWPENWSLKVMDGDRVLELSRPTQLGRALLGPGLARGATLQMRGFDLSRHDDAVEALEQVAGALFFELDVLYNMPLTVLPRRERRARLRPRDSVEHPPVFPRNQYSSEALALYRYGRSANALPLLEFLAYYQALEYFFPSFAHEETANALRTALLNPRFNPSDDAALAMLIRTAAPAIKAGLGERDQLKATVRAAVMRDELRDVLVKLESESPHFTEKKQRVRGLSQLNLESSDLRDQVAERIYTLRCRIVHTKQDGGGEGADLLLPTSREVRSLGPEIALLRFVTQQAIFARAKRAP